MAVVGGDHLGRRRSARLQDAKGEHGSGRTSIFGEARLTRAVVLSTRFDDAIAYARTIHADQVRKGTRIPYVAHLLSVAALVIEHGATHEDIVIGALLHDAAEDCGGRPRLDDIRGRFGDSVAAVAEGCTDTFDDPNSRVPPNSPRGTRPWCRPPRGLVEVSLLLNKSTAGEAGSAWELNTIGHEVGLESHLPTLKC